MLLSRRSTAVIAAIMLILLVSIPLLHPTSRKHIMEKVDQVATDLSEGKTEFTYYNQVNANRGLSRDEARKSGSHNFDGEDENGLDPMERVRALSEKEGISLDEAAEKELQRTTNPQTEACDPARLGAVLTAVEQVTGETVMPDEHDLKVGLRPNEFTRHAKKGVDGLNYALECYNRAWEVLNRRAKKRLVREIPDEGYTSQEWMEPYSPEMGGDTPKVIVEESEHQGGFELVYVLDNESELEFRIPCGFQWIKTDKWGWSAPGKSYEPSEPSEPSKPSEPDEPKPEEPKPEEPKEKDISKEYQSQHGSESPSTNGANDEDKTRKEATPDPSLEKTNPPEGHKDPAAPKPSKEYEEKKEKEEASKGTESGSKAKDEAPADVTTNKDNDWGDYSKEKEKAHKEEHMNPDKGSSSSGSSNKSSGSSNKSSGSSSSSGSGSGSSNKSSGSSSGGQRTEATKDPGLESGSKSSGSSSGSSNKSSGSSSSSGSGSNKSSGSSNGGSTPKKEPPAPKTDSNGDNVEVDPDTVE